MRTILIIFIGLLIISRIDAQEAETKKELKKEASKKKKEEKRAEAEKQYLETGKLLNSKKFVLEAEYLRDKMGAPQKINSTLNFISVDSINAVIQVGSVQRFGANGVGGVTTHGKIANWRVDKNDKKKSYDLFMTINASRGVYDVNMTVDYSGHAEATLMTYTSAKITFDGSLVPLKETSTYRGQGF